MIGPSSGWLWLGTPLRRRESAGHRLDNRSEHVIEDRDPEVRDIDRKAVAGRHPGDTGEPVLPIIEPVGETALNLAILWRQHTPSTDQHCAGISSLMHQVSTTQRATTAYQNTSLGVLWEIAVAGTRPGVARHTGVALTSGGTSLGCTKWSTNQTTSRERATDSPQPRNALSMTARRSRLKLGMPTRPATS